MVVQLELLHVLAVGNHHLTMSSPVWQKMLYAGSVGNEDIVISALLSQRSTQIEK